MNKQGVVTARIEYANLTDESTSDYKTYEQKCK